MSKTRRRDGICPKCGLAPKVERGDYCRECRNKLSRGWRKNNPEYNKEWLKSYREHRKSVAKEWKKQLKIMIMSWYGNECVCCGEKTLDFLTIDHINDDGFRERSRLPRTQRLLSGVPSGGGHHLYLRIKKLGYEHKPKDLQILCFNCQWGKRLNNGFCPHHPERDLRIAAGDETLTKEQTV